MVTTASGRVGSQAQNVRSGCSGSIACTHRIDGDHTSAGALLSTRRAVPSLQYTTCTAPHHSCTPCTSPCHKNTTHPQAHTPAFSRSHLPVASGWRGCSESGSPKGANTLVNTLPGSQPTPHTQPHVCNSCVEHSPSLLPVGASVASARLARLSMIKFTHSICTAESGEDRSAKAPPAAVTSATTLAVS
mgnify:CR=1 FL=1